MTPWSVIATAGIPSEAIVSISVTAEESASAVIREAPSSRENSVCVCRWTKLEAPLPIPPNVPRPSDVSVEIVWKSHTHVIPEPNSIPSAARSPAPAPGPRAGGGGVAAPPAVGPISDDWVTNRAEVHPDLMGPSRPGPGHQQGCPGEVLPHLEVGDGLDPGPPSDRHPGPVPAQGRLDRERVVLDLAPYQGQVLAADLASGQHLGELPMGLVVLGHDEQPGGAGIQPVDDSRPVLPAARCQRHPHPQEAVDQRAGPPRGRRVRDHAGWLRHHREAVVLVPDRHAAGLGQNLSRCPDVRVDPLATTQAERLRARLAVDQDRAPGDGPLDVGPGHPGQVGHDRIQPARDGVQPHDADGCRRRARSRRMPAISSTTAPMTSAVSARLNTGHTWKSMKSTTSPEKPGPRIARSVRLPRAPASTRPRPTAEPVEGRSREANRTAPTTSTLMATNSAGALPNSPNAPPGFVVKRSWTTAGITSTGGGAWGSPPARSSAFLSLMQSVAYGRALIRAFSIGRPHRSHSPYVPCSIRSRARSIFSVRSLMLFESDRSRSCSSRFRSSVISFFVKGDLFVGIAARTVARVPPSGNGPGQTDEPVTPPARTAATMPAQATTGTGRRDRPAAASRGRWKPGGGVPPDIIPEPPLRAARAGRGGRVRP